MQSARVGIIKHFRERQVLLSLLQKPRHFTDHRATLCSVPPEYTKGSNDQCNTQDSQLKETEFEFCLFVFTWVVCVHMRAGICVHAQMEARRRHHMPYSMDLCIIPSRQGLSLELDWQPVYSQTRLHWGYTSTGPCPALYMSVESWR